jgi:hypothetical protein
MIWHEREWYGLVMDVGSLSTHVARGGRVVVTAGHCLPELPPFVSLTDERTYGAIRASPTRS